MTAAPASDHTTSEHPSDPAATAGPAVAEQLALCLPQAHVRIELDRRTCEVGLAHIAAIRQRLAASAARRAAAAGPPASRSGRAA